MARKLIQTAEKMPYLQHAALGKKLPLTKIRVQSIKNDHKGKSNVCCASYVSLLTSSEHLV